MRLYLSTAGLGTDYVGFKVGGRDTLSTGWNLLLEDTSTTPDYTLGSTNLATITIFQIRVETNNASDTYTIGDLIMDFHHYASGSQFYKAYLAGYPTYDTGNIQATSRIQLLSNEALGYLVSECGEFNTDTIPLMLSHDVFTAISKSSTDEIILEWTHGCTD